MEEERPPVRSRRSRQPSVCHTLALLTAPTFSSVSPATLSHLHHVERDSMAGREEQGNGVDGWVSACDGTCGCVGVGVGVHHHCRRLTNAQPQPLYLFTPNTDPFPSSPTTQRLSSNPPRKRSRGPRRKSSVNSNWHSKQAQRTPACPHPLPKL
jgi:hypothetical protein